MSQIILYPSDTGSLCFVMPCHDCGLPIGEIARKDVPPGKPFLVVDVSDLPADYQYKYAWTADFSEPDGYGIGADAWFAEQAATNNGG
jgi:hypothetical protein